MSLLNRGFNDTYLVADVEGDRRVLRVYNRDKYWIRSESDLRFELDLLEHLAVAGLGVIRPYQRTVGDRLGRLMAPEGERCFALFTYAPGKPLYEGTPSAEQWREFGSGIAQMHLEMDSFTTSYDRYHLDERILVERPLTSLAPYAGSGRAAADLAELGKLGERLTDEIRRLGAIRGGTESSMLTCTGVTPTSATTGGSSRSTSITAGSGYARMTSLLFIAVPTRRMRIANAGQRSPAGGRR